jgi:spore germination protein YaaH
MKILIPIFLVLISIAPAQEQFKSSHQRDWEYYRDNPHMVGTTVVPPSLSKRGDLMKAQTMSKVVYGFHPYWLNGSEVNYYFSLLTHVAYFSADINATTGGFSTTNSWASANVVTLAKQYGVKVHLCLTLFSNHATLLSSTTAKNNLIQNTLTQLAVRNADGVNIDFEAVSSTVKTEFRTFMRQFGDSLKAHGYEFVIELPAVDWSNIFDATFFSTLNPVTDYYFAMLYDYWWSGSATAGPNAPLRSSSVTSAWHVLRSIDTYLNTKGCPANKFIAGFPHYGREWAVKSTVANADTLGGFVSNSRSYSVVKNNYIDTIPANRQYWSTTYNTRYYNHIAGGVWRQTWYDDSLSLGMKYDSIKIKNVAGTGMWALGHDGVETELWGALMHAFATKPNPAHTSFDNFESGVGRFTTSPTYSGSTRGISTNSFSGSTNDAANNGAQSLQVVLKDSTGNTTDWTVRHLSGTGSRANNVQFSNTGYVGFWMKTSSAPAGAQVAITIDDQRIGSSDKTELSSKISVVNDGQWHLYEWNLQGSGWSSFSGGNGVLDSATVSLDAIMFYAPDGSPDWTLFIDDVSHNVSGPLPVELDRMRSFSNKLDVHLQWNTATETNNYGFDIERRVAGRMDTDGNDNFVKIGFVEGYGTTSSPRSYAYTDRVDKPGGYIYRLRQIDRDGQFRYSAEMFVTISGYPESYSLEQNFPNPFNPVTTIQFAIPDGVRNESVRLTVHDMLGREVITLVNERKDAGVYSIQWNAAGFASGVYFYSLRAGDFTATKKLLLMK